MLGRITWTAALAFAIAIAAWGITQVSVDDRVVVAIAALALSTAFAVFGRQDLTRPHVAFPAVWYLAVGVAQLKLLDYETDWSTTTTLIVMLGPLAFAAGSLLTSGGTSRPPSYDASIFPGELNAGRLVVAATALFALGVIGALLKSQLQGGFVLLSGDIDASRSAIKIPAWVTFMTDSFFLSFWIVLLRIAIPGTRRGQRILLSLGALAALTGVASNASRNTILTALLVPVVFAYLLGATRRIRGRAAVGLSAFTLIVLLVLSGLFYVRTSQHRDSAFEAYFYSSVVEAAPPALRPLLPIHVGLATPFETLNRVVAVFPHGNPYGDGAYSVPGIPPAISPVGRKPFYPLTGSLSRPYYFNVATYEGPLYADGGLFLVLGGSLILGLLLGFARRLLLSRTSIAGLAVVAYLTYVAIFLVYENLLGFYTLSVIWDVAVLGGAVAACSTLDERLPWLTGKVSTART